MINIQNKHVNYILLLQKSANKQVGVYLCEKMQSFHLVPDQNKINAAASTVANS